ncbi:MAG: 2-hydroxyacid dehydrogenase [Planktomarina sp.]
MRVLVTRALPDKVLTALAAFADIEVRSDQTPMTVKQAKAALHVFDAILPTLGDDFSAAAFDEGGEHRCKLLANFGVGYNHIDVAAAQTAGVAVTNTPGAVTDATADIALLLMLMACRRAGEGERLVREGHWDGWHPTQLLGMHMSGKTVGIIGMGRIGQAIAQRCHCGFGMDVVYYNRSKKAVDNARQLDGLHEVCQVADIVVVAVPGGAETRHLIDANFLGQMKSTAVFVNIARGDVVCEADLVSALQNGTIAAAGLDVYEAEPKVSAALLIMENVTLLPHLGTAALEVRTAMGLMAVDNLRAFSEGLTLPNQV